MLIKYCPKCKGKPYTTDYTIDNCVYCGSALLSELTNNDDLLGRSEMSNSGDDSFGFKDSGFGFDEDSNDNENNSFGGFNSSDFGVDDSDVNHFGFGEPESDVSIDINTSTTILPSDNYKSPVENNRSTVLPVPLFQGNKDSCNSHSTETYANAKNVGTVIRGKITNYTNSQKENSGYKRIVFVKLLQAIVYKQRFDDILHSFTVRVNNGTNAFGNQNYADIPVNIHGIVSGGIQLVDNLDVEIYGKYHNGILMASSIYVLNNGYKSPVKLQHSAKAIAYGILALIATAFLIYIGVFSHGNFFQNIGSFLKTWLVSSIIVLVLYFILTWKFHLILTLTKGKMTKIPIIGILLVAFIISFLIFYVFVI